MTSIPDWRFSKFSRNVENHPATVCDVSTQEILCRQAMASICLNLV